MVSEGRVHRSGSSYGYENVTPTLATSPDPNPDLAALRLYMMKRTLAFTYLLEAIFGSFAFLAQSAERQSHSH